MKIFFELWNKLKQEINDGNKFPHFRTGEIRWAQLGQNIGTEVFGKGKFFQRPVIILKPVFGNSAIVIPLTSKEQTGDYYFSFYDVDKKKQYALLSQVRYLDGRRIRDKMSSISPETLEKIKMAFFSFLSTEK